MSITNIICQRVVKLGCAAACGVGCFASLVAADWSKNSAWLGAASASGIAATIMLKQAIVGPDDGIPTGGKIAGNRTNDQE